MLSWTESITRMFRAEVPTVLSMVISYSIILINIYFMGNEDIKDSGKLAAVGIGCVLTNILIIASCHGTVATIETFVS